jgi:hypothetical protein
MDYFDFCTDPTTGMVFLETVNFSLAHRETTISMRLYIDDGTDHRLVELSVSAVFVHTQRNEMRKPLKIHFTLARAPQSPQMY